MVYLPPKDIPDAVIVVLGASGFNAARLFELVGPEIDGLSPENVLMFGAGPLSGTLAPGSARLSVTAKSPLTDVYGSGNMGGFFAGEMKFAGYDQIIVFGKAKEPFDWKQRPFFLRFNTEDRKERVEVFRELCQKLEINSEKYLSR